MVSEEPEPGGHERWPWVVEVREVVSVPRLALAPELREIGVSPRSLSQHSHIALSPEAGRLAEQLISEADPRWRLPADAEAEVGRQIVAHHLSTT